MGHIEPRLRTVFVESSGCTYKAYNQHPTERSPQSRVGGSRVTISQQSRSQ